MGSSFSLNETSVKVELLKYTQQPEETISLAAKLCYSDSDISGLFDSIAVNDQQKFIEKIISIGHHSVLEHVTFTFGVEGISRALTHQLVRHRIASFSQKSQRYVKHKESFDYIIPPSIKDNAEYANKYSALMDKLAEAYDELLQAGIPAEDARYILPNSCETKIIITMNARELLHYFKIRCCNRAQWEIRVMSEMMLMKCIEVAPSIFKNSGPGCLHGSCPEKDFTCGEIANVRNKYKTLLAKFDKLN